MKFLTLEDATGLFEAILFPKTYQKYGHLIRSHGPYVITGRVQCEDFNTVVVADKIELVADPELAAKNEITAIRGSRRNERKLK